MLRLRTRSRRPSIETLEGRQLLSTLAGASATRSRANSPLHAAVASTTTPMTVTVGYVPWDNPDGNGVVTQSDVMLTGTTLPDAKVTLTEGDAFRARSTRANAEGVYKMPILAPIGQDAIKVEATDSSGQQASAAMTVTHGDIVIAWNETAVLVMKAAKENVGMASRNLAILGGAMYDAINDVDPTHKAYKFGMAAPAGANVNAAGSAAAYEVLSALYPKEQSMIDATMDQVMATVPTGQSRVDGLAFGTKIGADYLAWRGNDGSDAAPAYKIGTAPGQWRPTPPDYRNAWGPAWGQVTPFAVPNASAYDPPPPPALTSAEYAADLNQTESLGAVNSTTRTPEETQIGIFWAYDTAGVGPPVLMDNEIEQQVSLQQHNSLAQDARLFALGGVAMADAGIVAWQAKYQYALWRPVTAIQLADEDGNPATTADPTWMPYGSPGDGVLPNYTPPFPSYVSGHATFAGALFTVLANFYHTDDVHFTLTSDELPGVARSYTSFSQADNEVDASRIYLGIHFWFDETAGQAAGEQIGLYVMQHEMT